MNCFRKLIPCFLGLALLACDGEKTAGSMPGEADTRGIDAKPKIALKGLFRFAAMDDPGLCDSEKLVGSDCAGGELFFLEDSAHTVVYDFYCQGSDSISYILGNYEKKDSTVICRFDRVYSYLNDENDTLNLEAGRGSFYRSATLNSLVIRRAACASFPFYFIDSSEDGGNSPYVLEVADSTSVRFFLESMRRIEPFRGYFK